MFESVTKALQDEEIDMGSIRALFDELLKQIPELDEYHNQLHEDSSVVKCVDFENAIVCQLQLQYFVRFWKPI